MSNLSNSTMQQMRGLGHASWCPLLGTVVAQTGSRKPHKSAARLWFRWLVDLRVICVCCEFVQRHAIPTMSDPRTTILNGGMDASIALCSRFERVPRSVNTLPLAVRVGKRWPMPCVSATSPIRSLSGKVVGRGGLADYIFRY